MVKRGLVSFVLISMLLSSPIVTYAEGLTLYNMSIEDVKSINGYNLESSFDTTVYKGDTVEDWLSLYDKKNIIVEYYSVDGKSMGKKVPITSDMIKGFTTSSLGEKKFKINYAGQEYKGGDKGLTYTVEDKADSIDIKNVKTDYIINDAYNPSDWVVTGKFANGSITRKVPEGRISGFDTSLFGESVVTIRMFGITEQVKIKVSPDEGTIENIRINNYKKSYEINETFNEQGNLTVTYVDGTSRDVRLKKGLVSGFDTSRAGNGLTATINYKGKTALLTYDVEKDNSPTQAINDFTINEDITTEYEVGGSFDNKGTLLVKYADGSEETINIIPSMVKSFNTSLEGNNTVYVEYGGLSKEYIINVQERSINPDLKQVVSILIDTNVTTSYKQGDEFDRKGSLIVTYADNTIKNVPIKNAKIKNFDTGKVGTRTITVQYGNCVTSYDIIVNNKSSGDKEILKLEVYSDTKLNYNLNDVIGKDDVIGSLNVYYEDGSKENIPFMKNMTNSIDTSKVGNQLVTVYYNGKEISYNISVINSQQLKEISHISVKEGIKTDYTLNEKYIPNGYIIVSYTNGSTENILITEDMISGFDTTTSGSKNLKIEYGGKSVLVPYKVEGNGNETIISKKIRNIKLNNDITKKYKQHSKFDGKGTITINYEDGTSSIVKLDESMLNGFDTSRLGSYVVKVSYITAETQYTIYVDKSIQSGSSQNGNTISNSNTLSKRPTHQNDNTKIESSDSESISSKGSVKVINTKNDYGFNSNVKPNSIPNTSGSWKKDSLGNWTYILKDGSQAKSQWIGNGVDWFYLNTDGTLATGWNKINGYYYYLELLGENQGACKYGWIKTLSDNRWYFLSTIDGHLCEGWNKIDGKWYYSTKMEESTEINPVGSIWVNTVTPDGYKVNSDGVWIR